MRNLTYLIVFLLLLGGCIGTDIETQVEPILRISKSIKSMRATGSFAFESAYTNEFAKLVSADVIWESSDPTIISVNQDGAATAHKIGEATISILFDGLEDSVTVEVLESKEAITISNFVNMLAVGSSFQFEAVYLNLDGQATTPSERVWESTASSVLSVDQQGNVSALSVGTAEISVTSGNVTNTLSVESTDGSIVVEEEVRITNFTNSIQSGSTYTFEASFFTASGLPDSDATIVWSSSDNGVVSINANGVATADVSGMATITATANMLSASIGVEVPEKSSDERVAQLEGVGGYKISGTGVLKLVEEKVVLDFTSVSVEGPGPYFYLSNSKANVNGGVKLGIAKAGASSFNISDIKQGSTLGDYEYIVVWCEPFGVTLGFGLLSE
ncbi:MAG: hypothetical protein ACJA2S_002831 [Cyclobacteriaceae bacterium]|jgi:hypothetical protein